MKSGNFLRLVKTSPSVTQASRQLRCSERDQSSSIANLLHLEISANTTRTFHLGEEVFRYDPNGGRDEYVNSDTLGNSGLICEGRVRLLCQPVEHARSVSIAVLHAGDLMGVDRWLGAHPLPYRAIAASSGQIAYIPNGAVRAQLNAQSPLWQTWAEQAQQREKIAFFKGWTQLRSLPSQALRHHVLPHLSEIFIPAGASIAAMTADVNSYYWLRFGTVGDLAQPGVLREMGTHWRSSEATHWVARTDLRVYGVQVNPWAADDLAALLGRVGLTS